MGDDTNNNVTDPLDGDNGVIEDPTNNPPANNDPDSGDTGGDDPVTPPADDTPASGGGSEDDFLKYVKMANDLHWVPGILKTYGADNQIPFGEVEEEEYVENEDTEQQIFPNEYGAVEPEADDDPEEESIYAPEDIDPVVDDEFEEDEIKTFNCEDAPAAEENDDLDEEVFNDEYSVNPDLADDEAEEETFLTEACVAESAAAESPLNGEDEDLEEDTFNEPLEEAASGEEEGESGSSEKVREMLQKLLPTEDAEGAVQDPEWTFGKFMKAKFPDFVPSDRAAKFLDLVAQYSVVDAVERLAVQEAKEEVLANATGDEDQDELLKSVQEAAEEKRKQYLSDYVLPDAEGEPAKYRKFWKQVLDIITAL